MKKFVYQVPETTICDISIKYPYLVGIGDGSKDEQEANHGYWEENRLDEGLDNNLNAKTSSSLWDE